MNRNTARDVEQLEQRLLMAATGELRSIDGTGNNPLNVDWGSAGQALIRLVASQYADGIAQPAGADRPSAREISNTIAAHPEDEEMVNAKSLSAFAYLWGQFIDHDLDLTTTSSANGKFNIPVPSSDESFDPNGTGAQVIPLSRADFAAGTGVDSPREQVNVITAYLDGSMIYGSDAVRAARIRRRAPTHQRRRLAALQYRRLAERERRSPLPR
jgi:peroxidase